MLLRILYRISKSISFIFMITNIKINNYTLIDSLEVDFQRGFSVITGETGAGKSIILGALSLLLGQRADTNTIKNIEKKCIVEGSFNISGYNLMSFFNNNDIEYDENECILRREISPSGKSRAFINDTPVSITLLRELGIQLVDIHSQHQNSLINSADFQLNVLDIYAGNIKKLEEYQTSYLEYKNEKIKLDSLISEMSKCKVQEDYMRYQYAELESAALYDEDEFDVLEQRLRSMSHSEDIKSAIYKACNYLSSDDMSILTQMKLLNKELDQITNYSNDVQELVFRLDSVYIELKDASDELLNLLESVEFDPKEFEQLNERYTLLDSLLRKYRCRDLVELIKLRNSLNEKLSLIDDSTEVISHQEVKFAQAYDKAVSLADKLKDIRAAAAHNIENEMIKRLVSLGMPNVQFKVDFEDKELHEKGNVNVNFLFSANISSKLMPVSQVASGGEIARVMLALKVIIGNVASLPTIIFDEIDTGVSGKMAEAMANIMKEMGQKGKQVISITHLPQIAALGSTHYKVYKTDSADATITNMRQLGYEERVEEIAQMISGSNILDTARQQAKQLLAN